MSDLDMHKRHTDEAQAVALALAVNEAKRFIQAAESALWIDQPWRWANKRKAQAKRASLDLTRALARFRQGERP